jgi:hypothetical protein
MAANTVETQVEQAAVIGTGRQVSSGKRLGGFGAIAAVLITLLLGIVAIYTLRTSHSAAPTIPHVVPSAQTKFVENNTTNLPNAVTAEVRPALTSGEQRALDVNTTWWPTSVDAVPAMSTSQQRFLEVNTTMMPQAGETYPYAESETPMSGHAR